MKKIRTLVVDDEGSNRDLIKHMIEKTKLNFEVVAEADSIARAKELLQQLKPDLLFLDVKMPGGTGFQVLDEFGPQVPEVVFVSAYDAYAVKAFEYNALDYILKPIDEGKFIKTLLKVKERMENRLPDELSLQEEPAYYAQGGLNKIPIHEGKFVKLLSLRDLVSANSKDGCTEFVVKPDKRHTSSKQLSDFEYVFSKWPFMIRINKSTYINAYEIKSYSKGMVCDITLSDGSVYEISRRKKSSVLEAIKTLM
jgi:two-component system LytT family response regulator